MNKIILFLSLLLICFASCKKDEICDCAKDGKCQCQNNSQNGDANNDEDVNDDVYYITYSASISTVYMGDIGYITVATPDGVVKNRLSSKTYEETYGPVKKGFSAHISVQNTTSNAKSASCKIMISKNNGPFAVQAESKGYSEASCSYVIDL